MNRNYILSSLLLLFVFFINAEANDTIKVACVGNSITEGSGIKDKQKDSYPAVLQRLLGDSYKVENFGLGGRTMMNKGDRPYMKEKRYQEALSFSPDIVIIKLGTNDTKPQNWQYSEDYPKDMETMIDAFHSLPTSPQIYLCLPVPVMGTRWGINDSTMVNGVIPYIKEIAKKKDLKIIDLRTPLLGYPQYFPDNIHPNEKGAEVMANEVYRVLTVKDVMKKKHAAAMDMER